MKFSLHSDGSYYLKLMKNICKTNTVGANKLYIAMFNFQANCVYYCGVPCKAMFNSKKIVIVVIESKNAGGMGRGAAVANVARLQEQVSPKLI